MEDNLKSIFSGITEGLVTGLQRKSRIEHISFENSSMEIEGNYSSVTQRTGLHLSDGAQIKLAGNARIIQQD